MKMYSYLCRTLFCMFALMLFSSSFLFAQPSSPWYTEDTTRVDKANWLNTMGCYFDDPDQPCVEMYQDNAAIFRLRVRTATKNIALIPEMRMQYFLTTSIPGGTVVDTAFTPPITSDMLVPVILETGDPGYEAAFGITIDLSEDCGVEENFVMKASYLFVKTEVVSNNPQVISYEPYPIGDYPDVFPPSIFIIPPSGHSEPHSEEKHICCYDGVEPDSCRLNYGFSNPGGVGEEGGQDENNGGGGGGGLGGQSAQQSTHHSGAGAANFAAAFPNPFGATLQTEYQMDKIGTMEISCMDAQGRQLLTNRYDHAAPGHYSATLMTDDWSPGIYYLSFKTNGRTKTVKVVKLSD